MPRPFLTARWESLVLLNYACPAGLLAALVPRGTTLDTWHGQNLVSLVGFLFRDTRLRGLAIPFHRTFEEVNLRFYVRRTRSDGTVVRAVVFIRELVPKRAIAAAARAIYNEPYLALPMAHRLTLGPATGGLAEYSWRYQGSTFVLSATARGPARALQPETAAEFITEHYWGYTGQRDGGTLEYQVEHPRWLVWDNAVGTFSGPAAALYGPDFGAVLAVPPVSTFVAVGSEVSVHSGRRLVLPGTG
jgi:uncharacterized protein YqjF (DUF2071 family)